MALKDQLPTPPKQQSQCSESAFARHGPSCAEKEPCDECAYWPVYACYGDDVVLQGDSALEATGPRRSSGDVSLRLCAMTYTDDRIVAVPGDAYAASHVAYSFETLVAEGHDARALFFEKTPDLEGGHRAPRNARDWIVGCLGVVDVCDAVCEGVVVGCIASSAAGGVAASPELYAQCVGSATEAGSCAAGCAPTRGMLEGSEKPVILLAKDVFGGVPFGEETPGVIRGPRNTTTSLCVMSEQLRRGSGCGSVSTPLGGRGGGTNLGQAEEEREAEPEQEGNEAQTEGAEQTVDSEKVAGQRDENWKSGTDDAGMQGGSGDEKVVRNVTVENDDSESSSGMLRCGKHFRAGVGVAVIGLIVAL